MPTVEATARRLRLSSGSVGGLRLVPLSLTAPSWRPPGTAVLPSVCLCVLADRVPRCWPSTDVFVRLAVSHGRPLFWWIGFLGVVGLHGMDVGKVGGARRGSFSRPADSGRVGTPSGPDALLWSSILAPGDGDSYGGFSLDSSLALSRLALSSTAAAEPGNPVALSGLSFLLGGKDETTLPSDATLMANGGGAVGDGRPRGGVSLLEIPAWGDSNILGLTPSFVRGASTPPSQLERHLDAVISAHAVRAGCVPLHDEACVRGRVGSWGGE